MVVFFNIISYIYKAEKTSLTLNDMQQEQFVVLAEYNTLAEAEITKSILQSAGLWVDIRNEYMSSLNPISGAARVVVRSEDKAEAEMLLKQR